MVIIKVTKEEKPKLANELKSTTNVSRAHLHECLKKASQFTFFTLKSPSIQRND